MGGFIVFMGFAGLAVGIVAACKGSIPSLQLAGRRQAATLIAVSMAAILVGAAIASPQPAVQDPRESEISRSPDVSPGKPASVSPSSLRSGDGPGADSTKPLPDLPPGVPADAQKAFVAKVVDGDTIWAEVKDPGGPLIAGAVHKIRILEIDTPESANRTDCFGREATEFAKQELPVGSAIYLAADKEDKDRYGRFLRYVWKADGAFYNEKAVLEGYAKAVLYPPNDRYIHRLRAAEARAKSGVRGLWTSCAPAVTPSGPGF